MTHYRRIMGHVLSDQRTLTLLECGHTIRITERRGRFGHGCVPCRECGEMGKAVDVGIPMTTRDAEGKT